MHTPSARSYRLLATLFITALLCSGCYDLENLGTQLGLTPPPGAADAPDADGDATPADEADDAASSEGDPTADAGGSAPAIGDDPAPEPADAEPAQEPAETDTTDDAPDKNASEPKDSSGGGARTASDQAHGAGKTGPAAEACTRDGTRVDSPSAISSGTTSLLRAGTYDSLKVPSGATVKPYDCGDVTITGTVSLGDGATLAGVTVRSDASWVIKIGGRNVTVRNSTVQGGSIEAIRIHDGAQNVKLVGNNLDGGRDNHVVKVKSESGSAHPDNIVIDNNVFSKRYYDSSSEDLLQLEGHRHVTITNNTFANNPRGEDGVDVKQGTEGMVMRRNRFVGGNIDSECLLVQGSYAKNLVIDNVFEDCGGVSLGAHPEAKLMPWWRFEGNRLTDSQLRLRRSDNAEIVATQMRGGVLKLGISSNPDDTPRNLRIAQTTLNGVEIDNNLQHAYTCVDNVMIDVSGDNLRCSGTRGG